MVPRLLTPVRALRRAWRSSLQLRVVATTMAVSGVVVVGLGVVLIDRITTGLVDAKQRSALYEAETGQTYARQQLQALRGPNDADLQRTLYNVGGNLSARAGGAGQFGVVLVPADPTLPPVYSSQLVRRAVHIPAELTRRVTAENMFAYQFTRMAPDSGPVRPTLVVGAPVVTASGSFQLYYLFPLDDEMSTVGLVQNTLFATGLVLLLLVAGVAAIVTRQVVTPVRVAARTAERLSAGLLEERMRVVGEDDLAKLASSFNQMAANLQRQIVQLEDLSRLQRRFTSDVSHELRTPLTTVRMAADVLFSARDEFDPAMRRAAELLQTEVDRFESLLTDLLEISRYDAGFAVLEAEATDVRALVRHTAEFIRPLADRAGTPLRVSIPDYPIIAEVDPRRVERILRNLLGNAVEHGEGRPVEVALCRDVRAVAITVRDHGVGFKPGEAQIVFNRFWRADPSRARQTGGTGLGLSISLEDARLHGGWLQAWGELSKGAQFRLTLPLDAGAKLTASPLPLVPADAVLGPESVPAASVAGGSVPGELVPGGLVPGGLVPGGSVSGGPVPGALAAAAVSAGTAVSAVSPVAAGTAVSGVSPVSAVPLAAALPAPGLPVPGLPAPGAAAPSGEPGEIVTGAGGRRA